MIGNGSADISLPHCGSQLIAVRKKGASNHSGSSRIIQVMLTRRPMAVRRRYRERPNNDVAVGCVDDRVADLEVRWASLIDYHVKREGARSHRTSLQSTLTAG